jgi:hypothetical protein
MFEAALVVSFLCTFSPSSVCKLKAIAFEKRQESAFTIHILNKDMGDDGVSVKTWLCFDLVMAFIQREIVCKEPVGPVRFEERMHIGCIHGGY